MKDHGGDAKQYIHLAEAWYKDTINQPDVKDEVMFGFYAPGGGSSGEMGMRWYELNENRLVPRLEVFCDAWHALAQFKDVIDALAELDSSDITPPDFCRLLDGYGFVDNTPRKR